MKFSVLMSLYSNEQPDYLRQCLESLSQQTLPADEIVVVYDGPVTNELTAVIDEWQVKLPIRIIKLKENVGLGKALQHGLEHCQYDLVARMDTDDICRADRFEKQVKCFDEDKELACLGSWIDEFDGEPDNVTSVKKVPLSDEEIRKFSKLRNPMNHMTVVYKKAAVIDSGGYLHLAYMEDYYLWLRMLAKGYKFRNLEDSLVFARTGQGMLERRGGREYFKSELKLSRIKHNLGVAKGFEAYSSMMLRAGSRVVSVENRKRIYRYLRK